MDLTVIAELLSDPLAEAYSDILCNKYCINDAKVK